MRDRDVQLARETHLAIGRCVRQRDGRPIDSHDVPQPPVETNRAAMQGVTAALGINLIEGGGVGHAIQRKRAVGDAIAVPAPADATQVQWEWGTRHATVTNTPLRSRTVQWLRQSTGVEGRRSTATRRRTPTRHHAGSPHGPVPAGIAMWHHIE